MEKSLVSAFQKVDKLILTEAEKSGDQSGATAVTCLIKDDKYDNLFIVLFHFIQICLFSFVLLSFFSVSILQTSEMLRLFCLK